MGQCPDAVLAGQFNDYRLVVHRLPLSSVWDYVLTTRAGSQFTTSEREHYQYWGKQYWGKRLVEADQDVLPIEILGLPRMQVLMHYPGRGYYIAHPARQFMEKALFHLHPVAG